MVWLNVYTHGVPVQVTPVNQDITGTIFLKIMNNFWVLRLVFTVTLMQSQVIHSYNPLTGFLPESYDCYLTIKKLL